MTLYRSLLALLASLSAPDMVAKVKGRIQLDYQRHLLAAAFLDFMKLDAVGVHDDRGRVGEGVMG